MGNSDHRLKNQAGPARSSPKADLASKVPLEESRMSRPSRRAARLIGVGTALVAVAASAALVWQASYSAFSATTANPNNTWAAGSVVLSDDDSSDTAMFTATLLKPGS